MARTDSSITAAIVGVAKESGDIMTFAVRLGLLFSLFDGDASLWRRYLIDHGTLQQIEADLPFVLWIEEEARREENFVCL